MSVFSKMDGWKQINRIQSRTFQHMLDHGSLLISYKVGWQKLGSHYLDPVSVLHMSILSNTRKRKHENYVKHMVAQAYKKV